MTRYDIMVFPAVAGSSRSYSLVEDDNGVLLGIGGLPQLVTTIIRDMLSDRDALYPWGTSLPRLVGGTYDPGEIKALILRELLELGDAIKSRQRGSGLVASERLASLEVIDLDASTPGEVTVRILVTSEAGASATADVSI
jgi:hypothetical protein